MGKVVHLNTIPPKSETHEHAGQKYTVTFDPNAPELQRWVWVANCVREYPHHGSSATKDAAVTKAIKCIQSFVEFTEELEENRD
jgi:hypothetical protein